MFHNVKLLSSSRGQMLPRMAAFLGVFIIFGVLLEVATNQVGLLIRQGQIGVDTAALAGVARLQMFDLSSSGNQADAARAANTLARQILAINLDSISPFLTASATEISTLPSWSLASDPPSSTSFATAVFRTRTWIVFMNSSASCIGSWYFSSGDFDVYGSFNPDCTVLESFPGNPLTPTPDKSTVLVLLEPSVGNILAPFNGTIALLGRALMTP